MTQTKFYIRFTNALRPTQVTRRLAASFDEAKAIAEGRAAYPYNNTRVDVFGQLPTGRAERIDLATQSAPPAKPGPSEILAELREYCQGKSLAQVVLLGDRGVSLNRHYNIDLDCEYHDLFAGLFGNSAPEVQRLARRYVAARIRAARS